MRFPLENFHELGPPKKIPSICPSIKPNPGGTRLLTNSSHPLPVVAGTKEQGRHLEVYTSQRKGKLENKVPLKTSAVTAAERHQAPVCSGE